MPPASCLLPLVYSTISLRLSYLAVYLFFQVSPFSSFVVAIVFSRRCLLFFVLFLTASLIPSLSPPSYFSAVSTISPLSILLKYGVSLSLLLLPFAPFVMFACFSSHLLYRLFLVPSLPPPLFHLPSCILFNLSASPKVALFPSLCPFSTSSLFHPSYLPLPRRLLHPLLPVCVCAWASANNTSGQVTFTRHGTRENSNGRVAQRKCRVKAGRETEEEIDSATWR